MRFCVGTTNPSKVREIGAILQATGCELAPNGAANPEETEPDFEENAKLKALAYARATGETTISEDSGLVIPHLGGLPGPWSARFDDGTFDFETGRLVGISPSGRSREEIDRANNDRVLSLMRGVAQPRRAASFKVVMVVATPDGEILWLGHGESYGWIAEEARGANGFGYDPIFVGNNTFGSTYAQVDAGRKNQRSHRRQVLEEFEAWLANFVRLER